MIPESCCPTATVPLLRSRHVFISCFCSLAVSHVSRVPVFQLKSKKQVTDYISHAGFGGNEYETQGGSKVMTMQM